MKAYKELRELWDWLGFVLWMGNYRKARDTCEQIDKIAKKHHIANFIAMWIH